MSRRTCDRPNRNKTVMAIPGVLDGQPHVRGTGVLVSDVVHLFMVGLSVEAVATQTVLEAAQVEAVIRYEMKRRAARQLERQRLIAHALYIATRNEKGRVDRMALEATARKSLRRRRLSSRPPAART